MAERAAAREAERYGLHSRHMNEMMVRVLHTIGFDVGFRSGTGQYLYDCAGDRYLDLLSGFGVFAIGRNHPRLREALHSVIDGDLPNLVQMDLSVLAGLLAERLLALAPHLDKVFFANSGTEAVEAAIKFARAATGRPGIVHCSHAFHGLSYGALSLIGDPIFRQGFGPFVPNCVEIPFNDLAALEQAVAGRQIAAFVVEPIQGKGVNIPDDDYLPAVQRLCRKYGTLFVADEIQTGLGRTGTLFACDHDGVKPDVLIVGKALGGGYYPVSAVLASAALLGLFEPGSHGSTFGGNPLGSAIASAALDVILDERLAEKSRYAGAKIVQGLRAVNSPLEKEIRGRGLLIGIELTVPARTLSDALLKRGVAAKDTHENVLRIAPPLVIDDEAIAFLLEAYEAALTSLSS
jgi:ornithine--oxo-acid transaminase